MDTQLPTVPLGSSGLEITRVGFGAWAIGGGDWRYGWGAQDDQASIDAIHHAVHRGVNWIDTATVYGAGHSERVVGRAVAQLPESERPYVFTKCGQEVDPADPHGEPRRLGRASEIRRQVDASLGRLGLEQIDLMQMHWPPTDGSEIEEYWGALVELRTEGKVRAIGLSNHGVDGLERAEAVGHVDSLQPKFSPLTRGAAADVLPWCAAHQTGTIVYSPMESGLLTGRWSAARTEGLEDGDWRKGVGAFNGEELERNLRFVDALRPIAERRELSVAALAVAWTLQWPGVTGAIVGARSPEQVDGWVGAAAAELTSEDLTQIASLLDATDVGSGPLRPAIVAAI